MLELYHHGTSVCAAKVRLALAEKGVSVDRYHYVDLMKGDQFSASYSRINPNAVVPSLVHDGKILIESTLICEYIDEVFDGPELQPRDPYERYRMRRWTKAVDELLHSACSELTYVSCHRHLILRLPKAELDAYLDSTPAQTVKGSWRARKRELVTLGFDAPGIAAKFELYDRQLVAMDEALRLGPWLLGSMMSLADISLAPYVNRLAMLKMSGFWEAGRLPRLADWFARISQRPSFARALIEPCPAALAADLEKYGAESWPAVKALLKIA